MFSHSNGESQSMKRPSSSLSSSCFWENFLWTDVFSGNRYCVFNSVCCFKVWPFALKWSCFDRRWISQMEILRLNILVQEFSVNSETCWINVLTEASFVINSPCHCSHRWRSDSYRVLFNAACIEFMSDEQQERVVWFENGYILDKRSFFTRDPFSGFKDFQKCSFVNRKKDDVVCKQPAISPMSVTWTVCAPSWALTQHPAV